MGLKDPSHPRSGARSGKNLGLSSRDTRVRHAGEPLSTVTNAGTGAREEWHIGYSAILRLLAPPPALTWLRPQVGAAIVQLARMASADGVLHVACQEKKRVLCSQRFQVGYSCIPGFVRKSLAREWQYVPVTGYEWPPFLTSDT